MKQQNTVTSPDGHNYTNQITQISNGTKVITTGDAVYADGYNWYKIVLPSGSDEAWIAGSLIGH